MRRRITRRSQVQILPPQPNQSTACLRAGRFFWDLGNAGVTPRCTSSHPTPAFGVDPRSVNPETFGQLLGHSGEGGHFGSTEAEGGAGLHRPKPSASIPTIAPSKFCAMIFLQTSCRAIRAIVLIGIRPDRQCPCELNGCQLETSRSVAVGQWARSATRRRCSRFPIADIYSEIAGDGPA